VSSTPNEQMCAFARLRLPLSLQDDLELDGHVVDFQERTYAIAIGSDSRARSTD
jgi:hypothetical protein